MWIMADYVFYAEEFLELLNPIVGKTPGEVTGEVNRIMFLQNREQS